MRYHKMLLQCVRQPVILAVEWVRWLFFDLSIRSVNYLTVLAVLIRASYLATSRDRNVGWVLTMPTPV